MHNIPIIGGLLIAANFIFSYMGFGNRAFFDSYKFNVGSILAGKDYKRLITSGFLHGGWGHLLLNMYVLYIFSASLETYLGMGGFLLVYFASLLGGNLFALYINRNNSHYSAIGASGATSGAVFAFIALFPHAKLGLLLLPVSFPSWVFGLGYVLISIYGIKNKTGNIGHEAHLGGALVGLLTAVALSPQTLDNNAAIILSIGGLMLAFVAFTLLRPNALLFNKVFPKPSNEQAYDIDDRYNSEKVKRQKEIDTILDKIGKKGVESLSEEERKKLDDYSKR